MEPNEIKAVIECLLFVTDKPLSLNTLQGLLEGVDRRTLLETLDELKAEYDLQSRAFQLVEIAEGYQLSTRVQYAPWIRKLYKARTTNKLSRASLETLAIIAYRQPVTKAEVEDIRGVSSDGVVNRGPQGSCGPAAAVRHHQGIFALFRSERPERYAHT
jgi:segregation and condensation protein B